MKIFRMLLLFLIETIFCSLFHNIIYALTGIEEPFFFTLTFVFALGTIIFFIYGIIRILTKISRLVFF